MTDTMSQSNVIDTTVVFNYTVHANLAMYHFTARNVFSKSKTSDFGVLFLHIKNFSRASLTVFDAALKVFKTCIVHFVETSHFKTVALAVQNFSHV